MFKIDLILKEWSSIFGFFELKKYCIIFRKGGIHEKEFLEIESYFGIFKTHEHESIETLKPSCKSFLTNSTVEYTGTFDLEYIAKIKKSYLVDSFEKLEILDEFSPWNIDYLKDRFNFKPKKSKPDKAVTEALRLKGKKVTVATVAFGIMCLNIIFDVLTPSAFAALI